MRKLSLTGMSFGRLLVIRESTSRRYGKTHWECVCECGGTKVVCGGSLQSGATKSCGCGIAQANVERSTHGMNDSPEHKAWRQLIARCENEANPAYKDYGGRGIAVCPRWRASFAEFFSDMGVRPGMDYSIDRVDTNGDYEPGNCRWSTRTEQSENTRASRVWLVDGLEFPSSASAAKHFGVNQSTIARWCNGYRARGRDFSPKKSCSSVLKYEVSP